MHDLVFQASKGRLGPGTSRGRCTLGETRTFTRCERENCLLLRLRSLHLTEHTQECRSVPASTLNPGPEVLRSWLGPPQVGSQEVGVSSECQSDTNTESGGTDGSLVEVAFSTQTRTVYVCVGTTKELVRLVRPTPPVSIDHTRKSCVLDVASPSSCLQGPCPVW